MHGLAFISRTLSLLFQLYKNKDPDDKYISIPLRRNYKLIWAAKKDPCHETAVYFSVTEYAVWIDILESSEDENDASAPKYRVAVLDMRFVPAECKNHILYITSVPRKLMAKINLDKNIFGRIVPQDFDLVIYPIIEEKQILKGIIETAKAKQSLLNKFRNLFSGNTHDVS